MAVSVSSGIEELNPVGIDEVPVMLVASPFVVPRLGALPTLHVYAGSFAEVFAEQAFRIQPDNEPLGS